jgi:hypothetical protein
MERFYSLVPGWPIWVMGFRVEGLDCQRCQHCQLFHPLPVGDHGVEGRTTTTAVSGPRGPRGPRGPCVLHGPLAPVAPVRLPGVIGRSARWRPPPHAGTLTPGGRPQVGPHPDSVRKRAPTGGAPTDWMRERRFCGGGRGAFRPVVQRGGRAGCHLPQGNERASPA